MNKKKLISKLLDENIQLKFENEDLKLERMQLAADVARLKRQLSESRMRQADLVESSRGIHIL